MCLSHSIIYHFVSLNQSLCPSNHPPICLPVYLSIHPPKEITLQQCNYVTIHYGNVITLLLCYEHIVTLCYNNVITLLYYVTIM